MERHNLVQIAQACNAAELHSNICSAFGNKERVLGAEQNYTSQTAREREKITETL